MNTLSGKHARKQMRSSRKRKRPELFISSDARVINDPAVAPLIKRLKSNRPPEQRIGHYLPEDVWTQALEHHPDRDLVNRIIKQNRIDFEGGWEVTSNKELKCRGISQEYPAEIKHIVAALQHMQHHIDKVMYGARLRKKKNCL